MSKNYSAASTTDLILSLFFSFLIATLITLHLKAMKLALSTTNDTSFALHLWEHVFCCIIRSLLSSCCILVLLVLWGNGLGLSPSSSLLPTSSYVTVLLLSPHLHTLFSSHTLLFFSSPLIFIRYCSSLSPYLHTLLFSSSPLIFIRYCSSPLPLSSYVTVLLLSPYLHTLLLSSCYCSLLSPYLHTLLFFSSPLIFIRYCSSPLPIFIRYCSSPLPLSSYVTVLLLSPYLHTLLFFSLPLSSYVTSSYVTVLLLSPYLHTLLFFSSPLIFIRYCSSPLPLSIRYCSPPSPYLHTLLFFSSPHTLSSYVTVLLLSPYLHTLLFFSSPLIFIRYCSSPLPLSSYVTLLFFSSSSPLSSYVTVLLLSPYLHTLLFFAFHHLLSLKLLHRIHY